MKGRKLTSLLALVLALIAAAGCEERIPKPQGTEKVFIIYSCGHNNLSYALLDDIKDIAKTSPYLAYDGMYKILVFSHSAKGSDWSVPVEPVIMQVNRDRNGDVVLNTLKRFKAKTYDYYDRTPSEEGYSGSEKKTLMEVLSYVKTNFPANSYGFLFSSHGTGWLPYDYYRKGVITKTIGADYSGNAAAGVPIEMEVTDFADAFRQSGMYMEYMLMDACFMGGIETAYELRDVCRYFLASPCEIDSGGLMYNTMLQRLFSGREPDLQGLCTAYMKQYSMAAISLVDCKGLENLATVCKIMFDKYRTQIDAVDERTVQALFRRHGAYAWQEKWCYDLEDILVKAGINEFDHHLLTSVLDACVLFKDHTGMLWGDTECKTFCGLSMYLPCAGTPALSQYYRRYSWNKDTALVR